MKKTRSLFWFRRDLRIEDNAGFYYALKESDMVAPVFIFNKNLLLSLPKDDKRVRFVWHSLNELKNNLKKLNSDIIIKVADPVSEIVSLAKKFNVDKVYTNESYEPNEIKEESILRNELADYNIELRCYKDSVIFSKNDLLNHKGQGYLSFSNYKNAWLKNISQENYQPYTEMNYYYKLCDFKSGPLLSLEEMGFIDDKRSSLSAGEENANKLFKKFTIKTLKQYFNLRNFPFISGVSYLSTHLRFGTISIRKLVSEVYKQLDNTEKDKNNGIKTWLAALIGREFYAQVLYHNPRLLKEPFHRKYLNFQWENDWDLLQKWCEGKTGFPIVDAAMKQLNHSGYIHNRMRLIVANFLVKDLLIDYKYGELYFATKLLDYDLCSNNANWQWIASVGCDNNTINFFNPSKQSEKFDSEGRFIKKYLPIFKNVPIKYLHEPWKFEKELKEYNIILGQTYPYPIVNHMERKKIAYKKYSDIENLR